MHLTAPVTNISKCSFHDGPGIRTVVYFKGCSLHCQWCHNPETISKKAQILYIKSKCIYCGKCISVCPAHHKIQNNSMVFSRTGCAACGKCVHECPSGALELCGIERDVDYVFNEIQKDMHYYVASDGGVTFSGGECLLHADFLAELAKKCKTNNIHTAVESAFFVPYENAEKVLPYIDLFFADLKIPNPQKHKKFTGHDNYLIIDNIKKLSLMHDNIILRIPVIPGINDSEEDINGFAEIIKSFKSGLKEVEMLRYNPLAKSKYEFAGKKYTSFSDSAQSNQKMQSLISALSEKCGIKCSFV